MKALTLKHPWAWCVAHLHKDVENREWSEAFAFRIGLHEVIGEPIAIHGGAPVQFGDNAEWKRHELAVNHIGRHILPFDDAAVDRLEAWVKRMGRRPTYDDLVTPGIVAVATISHATRASQSPWAVKDQLHLLLSNIIALPEPVPCKGARSFWDVPAEVEQQVQAQLRQATPTLPAGPVNFEAMLR